MPRRTFRSGPPARPGSASLVAAGGSLRIGRAPPEEDVGVPPDEYALPTRSRVGGRAAAGFASLRSFGLPPYGPPFRGALRIPHASRRLAVLSRFGAFPRKFDPPSIPWWRACLSAAADTKVAR